MRNASVVNDISVSGASWWAILLWLGESRLTGWCNGPAASHLQSLSKTVVSSTSRHGYEDFVVPAKQPTTFVTTRHIPFWKKNIGLIRVLTNVIADIFNHIRLYSVHIAATTSLESNSQTLIVNRYIFVDKIPIICMVAATEDTHYVCLSRSIEKHKLIFCESVFCFYITWPYVPESIIYILYKSIQSIHRNESVCQHWM